MGGVKKCPDRGFVRAAFLGLATIFLIPIKSGGKFELYLKHFWGTLLERSHSGFSAGVTWGENNCLPPDDRGFG